VTTRLGTRAPVTIRPFSAPQAAPIASATSLAQFAELAAALTLRLTPGQISKLDAASA